MEQKSEPRRRLTVFGREARTKRIFAWGREARTKRIFAWLREGWAYDEIAREEGVSPQRVRQIVSKVLDKRVIDRSEDHARLQLARLARRCAWPATR
jgi:DNA-binding NarL/FixJ family response regulator